MIIYNCDQRSDEWHEIRKGKMTASNAATIIANGKGMESYIYAIMAEKYSKSSPQSFSNPDIERGIALEDDARKKYEEVSGLKVDQVGFIELDEYTGCSPDGLVGKDGGIEIKCPNDINYFKILLGGIEEVNPNYLYQIQMNLYVTGRKWWDYVAYNPNFDTEIIMFRVYPDKKVFDKIEEGLKNGYKLITEIKYKFDKDKQIGYEVK